MNNSFTRKEKKYVLDADVAVKMRDFIKERIPFSVYHHGTIVTDIRNTYLDNDSFYLYRLKKAHEKTRYKIRFREYGKKGTFDDNVWVELKEKRNGVSFKNRFLLDKKYFKDLLKGRDIFSKIVDLNKSVDLCYLHDLYETIRMLIKENSFYPRVMVQYKRQAFQDGVLGQIRVTFDSSLSVETVDSKRDLFCEIQKPHNFRQDRMIMEIKTNEKYPEWLRDLMKRYDIKRSTFSKYIFGVETCFSPQKMHQEVNHVGAIKQIVFPEPVY
jgi:SPX domain protein involved in polyphosphate accumulation